MQKQFFNPKLLLLFIVVSFSLLSLIKSSILTATATATSAASPTTNPCAEYFEQFSLAKIQNYLPILMYSGLSPFDLGNYEECIITNNTNYLIMTILSAQSSMSLGFPISLGLCLPSACNAANTETFFNTELAVLNVILNNLNITDPIESIAIIDPSDIPYENDGWLYLSIILLSAFIILCILATIKYQYTIIKDDSNKEFRNPAISISNDSHKDNTMKISTFGKVLDCFDMSKNFHKLFDIKIPEEHDKNLGVLNGIRTLSFFYVIYGHEYAIRGVIASNMNQLIQLVNEKWILFVDAGEYAVDVFFFLSGFLVSFVMLGKLKKLGPSIKNYCSIVFHRYIRIMPLYFVCILIYWKISVLIGSGPVWYSYVETTNQACDTRWWQHLFFGDNIFILHDQSTSEYCFGWGWYLAVDFQLFLFTPFLLWFYIHDQKKGKFCMALITIGFLIVSIILSIIYKMAQFPLLQGLGNSDFIYWYYTPYARGSPYYYGLLIGILYKEWKASEKQGRFIELIYNSRLFRVLVSLFGIGIMMFIMWIPAPLLNNPNAWPIDLQYFYAGVEKLTFTIGMSLFILPSLLGKNRLFTSMLNNSFFLIMAKISYCGYLMHYIIILVRTYSSKQTFYVSNITLFYDWIDTLVITIVISLVLILLVELPFVNLEKIFMSKRTTRPKYNDEQVKKPFLIVNDTESN